MLFDVAIVAAVLAAQRVFRAEELRGTILLGELGLDGRLRPIRGILPATLAAQQAGFTRVIVPLRQAGEAKLVEGIEVFGIASITQLVAFLRDLPLPPVDPIEVWASGLVVTGLVDGFSYLRLGHVFVANMTGNVVFLGFALAGVGEISIVASLLAIVAFALGAALGGLGDRASVAPWPPTGCRHSGPGGRRSGRIRHRKHRRC